MIRNILKKEIEKAVEKLFGKKISFSVSGGGGHADYATNVALIRQPADGAHNPWEMAENIKNELLKSIAIRKFFSKIEVAGPGFLNFNLSEEGVAEGIKNLNKKSPKRKQKISLDYLDANPTGPVHLGHARSGFYGDVLSNILEFYGYKVTREYYVNNAKTSGQIQSLGRTALSVVKGGQGEEYKHGQLLVILKKPEVKKKLKKIKEAARAGFYIAKLIQKENEKFLKTKAKIKFDLFFEEESVYASDKIKEVIEKLKKSGAAYEKDGALWFESTRYGDSEDRVIVRSTGAPTYFLPDVCYHLDRLVRRKNDLVINIFGADHYGTLYRVRGALAALGINPEKIIYLLTQMVRLVKDGREIKMSKRKGEFVTLEELINEVGLDAVRYFFLTKSLDTQMDFDLDLAKEQSKKNPVYYVQYAHTRMHSILAKSQIPNPKSQIPNYKLLTKKQERALILKLIQFPEIIEDISKDYQTHRLTTYVYELAKVFTEFYENVPVIKAEGEKLKKARLALVSATKIVLGRSFGLLGISIPEKM